MKSFCRLSTALIAVLFTFCTLAAKAQVLDQVPEQAMVVVKVSNLDAFSQKFGKLATDLQLAAMVPPLADPLAALQEQLKIKNGLDKAGEAAFAYLDPAIAGGRDDQAILLLWPVTDYKAFLTNFGEPKEENGIAEVSFADAPMPAYVAHWGKYAAMSPSKEIAALKPKGMKVQGLTAKEMGSKDIIAMANMAQLRLTLQPKLTEGRGQLMQEMDRGLARDPQTAKFAPVIKAVVNQLLNMADSFLKDAQSATLGISIGDNGISSTLMAEFEPASYMGVLAKKLKNTDASLLAGLPAGKYLIFGGNVNEPETMGKVFDDLVSPIMTELKKVDGDEAAAIGKYVAAIRKNVVAAKGQTFGMIEPTGALGQEPLIQFLSIQTGDAPALKTAYQEMMTSQQEVMKAFTPQAQEAMKVTTTPNEKTLDGVAFDVTHTEFNMPGGRNAAQAQQMMAYMYGPNGMTVSTGVIGDKMLMGFGTSDQILSSAIASAKLNEDVLSKLPTVTAVASNLPKTRLMAVYFPLDELVTTIGTYVGAMGMPVQIQLPPDLPPIGCAIGTEGTAVREDVYVPTDLIKAMVAQGMQLYIQAQGGMRPGGPGGL